MSIEDQLKKLIHSSGFVSIELMMQEVLTNNKNSYYKKPNILGASGDFITSPEISQLFGEIIGLWAIEQWQRLGCPATINLIELGPGRGLLMRDLLRTAKLVPTFYQSLSVQLLEVNPYLINEQQANLAPANKSIKWLSDLKQINQAPSIFIANEFFDALPIKQYVKDNNLWQEIVLTVKNKQLKFAKAPVCAALQSKLLSEHINAKNGAVFEQSPASLDITTDLAKHLKACSGAALIIDYGYDIAPNIRSKQQYNSTLQGVKNHHYHPILDLLGTADLSTQVDFYALIQRAKEQNISIEQMITQKQFLNSYGIEFRLELLSQNLEEKNRDILRRQAARLLDKEQMGELFKVLIISNYIAH